MSRWLQTILMVQKEPHKAITTHCKHGIKYPVPDNQGVIHDTWVIPEPDIYRLIIRSQMPRAEQFEDWVFNEVLPAIRKTGAYGVVPDFVRRFNDNWMNVDRGHFSILSELFVRLYGKFEMVGYKIPDKVINGKIIRPDVSVGKLFASYLKENHPEIENKFKYYNHTFPNDFEVKARQYEDELLPIFIKFVETGWIPQRAERYFKERDPIALNYLPKVIEGKQQKPDKLPSQKRGILKIKEKLSEL
ncbi:hypothetical protein LCGC14_1454790 [marine sediment metagenome]|uniref:Bro-N domain-containing protein n=1 Tax=marine sediment metagenome TaxID=412755 RepID=A0A0F9MIN5_9ZZZZ